jgi:hypothetical protein
MPTSNKSDGISDLKEDRVERFMVKRMKLKKMIRER